MAVVFFVLFTVGSHSLTKFGYRGIAFDSNGEIIANQTVVIIIELINTNGVVYKEFQINVKTNQFGAYTIEIGNGTVISGNFASVSATKDLKIKSAVSGGGVWVVSSILKPTTAITDFSDSTVSGGRPHIESVTIGSQTWSAKNYDLTVYRNGDLIPQVTDPNVWDTLTTGAWCYYNNDPSNNATYGKLYNGYALKDPRGFAPEGWHIPTDDEWITLELELGMDPLIVYRPGYRGTDQGSKLAGNAPLWANGPLKVNPNFGTSGFNGLPGGRREQDGRFINIGYYANWWTMPASGSNSAWFRLIGAPVTNVYREPIYIKYGFSVRLVKD